MMDKSINSLSSAFNLTYVKDQTYEKLDRAKAIIACLIFSTEIIPHDIKLDEVTINHSLKIAGDYLEDISKLFKQWELKE